MVGNAGTKHLLVPGYTRPDRQATKVEAGQDAAAIALATLKALAQDADAGVEGVSGTDAQRLKLLLERRIPSFKCRQDTYYRCRTRKWRQWTAPFCAGHRMTFILRRLPVPLCSYAARRGNAKALAKRRGALSD